MIGFLTVLSQNKNRKNFDKKRTILFLDNCSAHPNDELLSADGKITAKFLLPNVTAMYKGVHESIKRVNKKQILRDLVLQSTFSIQDILTRMIQVVDTIASAWNMVTPTAIRNSQKNCCYTKLFMQNGDLLEKKKTASLSSNLN